MYFGVGVENLKNEVNLGTLWRSANNLGASFIFSTGRRYRHQSSDTTKTYRNIPYHHYLTFDDFYEHLPFNCRLVGVELVKNATPLPDFIHPPTAVYILGAEDGGIKTTTLEKCHQIVKIPSLYCLNVATAASIVMYDRVAKSKKLQEKLAINAYYSESYAPALETI